MGKFIFLRKEDEIWEEWSVYYDAKNDKEAYQFAQGIRIGESQKQNRYNIGVVKIKKLEKIVEAGFASLE